MNKELIINPLPSKTWNFLRVNDRRVVLPGNVRTIQGTYELKNGLSSVSEDAVDSGIIELLDNTESAMGRNFSGLIKEYPSDAVFIKDAFDDNENDDSESLTVSDVRINLCFDGSDALSLYKTKMVVKEGAELICVMNFTDENADADIYAASEVRAYLEKGASLTIVQIFNMSDKTMLCSDIVSSLEEDAEIKVIHVMISGKGLNVACLADLNGDNSKADFKTGYSAKSGEVFDMNYIARQKGKKTEAEITANGALQDGSEKLYRTTVDFIRGCSGSSGKEEETVLLLDENVINKTVPLILCTEEAVSGEHGASIGKISDDVLYYMASRGIEPEEARRIMTVSGLVAAAENIPDDEQREKLINELQKNED